jgi:hypothetical protein
MRADDKIRRDTIGQARCRPHRRQPGTESPARALPKARPRKRRNAQAVLGRAGRPSPLTKRGHLDRPGRWLTLEQVDAGDRIGRECRGRPSAPGCAADVALGGSFTGC